MRLCITHVDVDVNILFFVSNPYSVTETVPHFNYLLLVGYDVIEDLDVSDLAF